MKSGIRLYRTATNVLLTPGVTTGGLLPLHFIHEVRNILTGEIHYRPPVAGDDSLWPAEGRLPPMPGQRMSGMLRSGMILHSGVMCGGGGF